MKGLPNTSTHGWQSNSNTGHHSSANRLGITKLQWSDGNWPPLGHVLPYLVRISCDEGWVINLPRFLRRGMQNGRAPICQGTFAETWGMTGCRVCAHRRRYICDIQWWPATISQWYNGIIGQLGNSCKIPLSLTTCTSIVPLWICANRHLRSIPI